MASVPVTTEDVAKRFDGDFTQFRADYAAQQVLDVVDYADSLWGPAIEARLATGQLTPNLYRRVIADAVLRVMRNPDGYASENEGGYGYSTRATVASGYLWFTDQDVSVLTGSGGSTLAVGSIAIGIPPR